jgi:hypothetical protein
VLGDVVTGFAMVVAASLFVHYVSHDGWWASVAVGAFLAALASLPTVARRWRRWRLESASGGVVAAGVERLVGAGRRRRQVTAETAELSDAGTVKRWLADLAADGDQQVLVHRPWGTWWQSRTGLIRFL